MHRSMRRRYTGTYPIMHMKLAAVIAAVVLVFAGCAGSSGAEAKAAADLEDMRYVELDQETDAELQSMLSDQGKEYFEMFLGKAGEFEYKVTGTDEEGDAAVVHVRIITYDFGSEYLRSWSEFLEGSDGEYDSAVLYETLFRNLSNVKEKDHIADIDIRCTRSEDGSWETDAKRNAALRNAILGGMIEEISNLAGI